MLVYLSMVPASLSTSLSLSLSPLHVASSFYLVTYLINVILILTKYNTL